MLSCCTCRIECAIEVDIHYIMIVRNLSVKHGPLSPGNAGVSDEYVKTAVEFFDDFVGRSLNVIVIGGIDLVCSACSLINIQSSGNSLSDRCNYISPRSPSQFPPLS
jgi:hypothetical protein